MNIDPKRETRIDLFVASVALLALELACIRWLPDNLRLLSYFSNSVLLGCFMGMSLGLLVRTRFQLLLITLPLLMSLACALSHMKLSVQINPETFSQLIYFGAEMGTDAVHVPFLVVLLTAYLVLIALFSGLGQSIGHLLERLPPLQGYTVNIAGSIVGTVLFMLASALSLSPVWWFGAAGLCILWLLRRHLVGLLVSMGCLGIALGLINARESVAIWSPYNRIMVTHNEFEGVPLMSISVNEMGFQDMLPNRLDRIYDFPYVLASFGAPRGRAPQVGEVLVIGAGSGNDVSRALLHGATSVDAVEIDPQIQRLGVQFHPEHPYADARVHAFVDDGRSFLRQHDHAYDWVIFAKIDSLSLLSQYSALRLENYLFTREAMEDVRRHLKPSGIFAMYNFFRKPWLAARIYRLLEGVFGADRVLAITLPQDRAVLGENDTVSTVLFMCGNVGAILESVKDGRISNGERPLRAVDKITIPAAVTPTDDWPFLYLRQAAIPPQNLEAMLMMAIVSFLLCRGVGGRGNSLRWHFFFLGCAFMLIETAGIARLALLFGSTWLTNSLAFLAILSLILGANFTAGNFSSLHHSKLYRALFAALLLELCVPMRALLFLPLAMRGLVGCLILFLPIFFASLLFARSFRDSEAPDYDLGSNVFGAVIGGCLENLSVVTGYHSLTLIAVLLYGLSFRTLRR